MSERVIDVSGNDVARRRDASHRIGLLECASMRKAGDENETYEEGIRVKGIALRGFRENL